MEKVIDVVIVGAGPAGLATSACLNRLNISNLVLEREDCYASLWRNRAYDRLKLHLAKQFYELPFMPFPKNTPKYAPKKDFIHYLDTYVATFNVSPKFHRSVKSASYDEEVGEWCLLVNNTKLGIQENYYAKILVVASGENSEGYIPQIDGLESFKGEIVHLSEYGNGDKYSRKDVLVVGAGNSEMEIAYDLSNFGANTSIVVRGPVHVVTEEIVYYGMSALKYFSVKFVDVFVMLLAKLKFGNLSKYGIYTPTMRPFHIKQIKRSIPHHRCWDYPKKGEIRVTFNN